MTRSLHISFQTATLYGQTLNGTWQGVLKRTDAPNGEQRIVIKVSTTEADKLAATMYFIKGGATTLVPSSAVTANGTGLKMAFERINGAWEGQITESLWTSIPQQREYSICITFFLPPGWTRKQNLTFLLVLCQPCGLEAPHRNRL